MVIFNFLPGRISHQRETLEEDQFPQTSAQDKQKNQRRSARFHSTITASQTAATETQLIGITEASGLSKQEQIRHHQAFDATKRAVQSIVDDENILDPSLPKSNYCFVPLSIILFSDRFAERLAHSKDAVTREQLEAGAVNAKSLFWKDVGAEYPHNMTDYNSLFAEVANNPHFASIDPSIIVKHNDARFYEMWEKATASTYRQLAGFMYPVRTLKSSMIVVTGDLMHSSKVAESSYQDNQSRANLIAGDSISPASTTQVGNPDADRLIDRITKLYRLIDHVKERQRKSELAGVVDASLTASLNKYHQRL
ncbi:unnamed protein product [Phytophthora fragariaefolia]|uniref:Unnamed protein product n=1 Tax=Phytophthora fragariaefolia TaxID=1490495 RepID=A0A9W7D687_9STRA|nr:unnamed protein product [Phytophthora fragariaefolia]